MRGLRSLAAIAAAGLLSFGGQAAFAESLADTMVAAYRHSALIEQNRAVLRAAARSVHRPDGAEAAATLPSPRPATTPVPRGDLPPNGDGAPDNSVDIGG